MINRRFRDLWPFGISLGAMIGGYAGGWLLARATETDLVAYNAGAFATFAGIVAGVPLAVLLVRWQVRRQETAKEFEHHEARGALLRYIAEDLAEIHDELLRRQPRQGPIAPFLGTGVWDALKASGQTELIASPILLRDVARAYDRVAVTAYVERQLWEIVHDAFRGSGQYNPTSGSLDLRVMRQIEDQDRHTKAAIDVALGEIATDPRNPHKQPVLTQAL